MMNFSPLLHNGSVSSGSTWGDLFRAALTGNRCVSITLFLTLYPLKSDPIAPQ